VKRPRRDRRQRLDIPCPRWDTRLWTKPPRDTVAGGLLGELQRAGRVRVRYDLLR
jgi:hypothetical protein